MTISKATRHAEVHRQALEEFDTIQAAQSAERQQCLEDRRFYSIRGAQWEGAIGEQFENRLKYEYNKVHLAVIRIFNEYRNNRISVDFVSKDGSDAPELAETCAGLYRADEYDSGAREAYDNAFEEGVGGGIGAWRLRACYEDDEDEENESQRIKIEPIFDADTSVYFDLDAKRQDKADARCCYVIRSMSHAAFREEFGSEPASWPKDTSQQWDFEWYTPDVVYVAEYYKVEKTRETIHIYRGLDGSEQRISDEDLTEDPEKAAELAATGFREMRQKTITCRRVHKYILSGAGVEADEGYIAGKHIPVIPFYGKRWFVGNVERCMGHVRLAKDAQRMLNAMLSWLTEMSSRFDMEKPIFAPEQILAHKDMWADDNVKRYPYLLADPLRTADGDPIPGSQVPQAYTRAPQVPPAMAALFQIGGQALEDLLGNQQSGEQLQPNMSGKAVELVQNRLDMQVFIYMSNFAKSMQRSGEVWLSMAKEILTEEGRSMKTVTEDGSADSVTLRTPTLDSKTGEQGYENDLSEADFDVWVDVGPSSSSRKAAAVRALTGMAMITQDPSDKAVLTAAAMMNLEGEGLASLEAYYRKKLVRMGVITPTEEEEQDMLAEQQNQKPDPQAQFLMASAQQAEADAALKRGKAVESVTNSELNQAKTLKTLSDTPGAQPGNLASDGQLRHMLDPRGPGQ